MKEIKNSLLYVGGSKIAFRCHCGTNVFHKIEEEELIKEGRNKDAKIYECNGCGDWYSEPPEDEEIEWEKE